MEREIRLSSNEFKALSSDTRAGIIKLLKKRNHTLTEMSKKLKLAAPTVKQHLGILEGAELIQELDEGRKWKYYVLTKKGKNIFAHEAPVNVLIVLGVSIFALCGLAFSYISMLGQQAALFASRQVVSGSALIGAADGTAVTVPGLENAAATAGGKGIEEGTVQVVHHYIMPAAESLAVEPLALLAFGIAVAAFVAGFFIAKALK